MILNLIHLTSKFIVIFLPIYLLTGCSSTPKTPNEIKEEAKTITVKITGKINPGSGVIIDKKETDNNQTVYYVLTSKHVVGDRPSDNIKLPDNLLPEEKQFQENSQEDPYRITTYNNRTYIIDYETVKKDETLDLAIVEFSSEEDYPIARLSRKLSQNQPTYIYGFKGCFSEPSLEKQAEFNSSSMTQINPNRAAARKGYGVNYGNPTITGMSGSPVFNQYGQVIAIHGEAGKRKVTESLLDQCPPSLPQNLGNNWGISIKDFYKSSLYKIYKSNK